MAVYFSTTDVKTLREVVSWWRVQDQGLRQPRKQPRPPSDNVWSRIVKTPTAGIPAYVEPDPGSADCDLCRKTDAGELEVIDAGVAIVEVWNSDTESIPGDEFINVWRDPWGTWWARRPSAGGAFFLTPAGGIPAAGSKFSPSFATSQMYRYNGTSIVAFSPPKFEQLGNHIQAAIGGNKVVQAKRINGSWFVDVEPCS